MQRTNIQLAKTQAKRNHFHEALEGSTVTTGKDFCYCETALGTDLTSKLSIFYTLYIRKSHTLRHAVNECNCNSVMTALHSTAPFSGEKCQGFSQTVIAGHCLQGLSLIIG